MKHRLKVTSRAEINVLHRVKNLSHDLPAIEEHFVSFSEAIVRHTWLFFTCSSESTQISSEKGSSLSSSETSEHSGKTTAWSCWRCVEEKLKGGNTCARLQVMFDMPGPTPAKDVPIWDTSFYSQPAATVKLHLKEPQLLTKTDDLTSS